MTTKDLDAIVASFPRPRPIRVRPIIVIGAGGIVRAAHLPAYAKADFPILALMDPDLERAQHLAAEFSVPTAFGTMEELLAFAPKDAVFDVAVPASRLMDVLAKLPDSSVVLMQKPMGETLEEARAIRDLCRQKRLTAAVNFTLRTSPNNLAIRALHAAGLLGDIFDLQVQTTTYTPWKLWNFLSTAPRVEILYHSIHYFDLIGSWLGDPSGVFARTVKDPENGSLAATRTVAILDYGPGKRVFVTSNHQHTFGPRYQDSFVQWEGTRGAARIRLGLNLDYPSGVPDTAEYAARTDPPSPWQAVSLSGNNFPDGFIDTMGGLQAFAEGSVRSLASSFDDAYRTMALVEALYRASERPGEPLQLDREAAPPASPLMA